MTKTKFQAPTHDIKKMSAKELAKAMDEAD